MSKARDLAGIFNLGPRSGTTAQRPSTAEVGDIFYNGTTGKTEIYTTTGWKEMASGIPFGNTASRPTAVTGQPYFNGEAGRLEMFTPQGWQNIVQEVPGVASITGTYSEATNSGTITIAGTNFTSGAIASAIGTNGVEIIASSTTYNSLVQVVAVFTGLSNANEPYDIKVTNPSNLFGFIPDALYVNASPVWQTTSGSLGTFAEEVSITLSALSSTDSDSATITYALASGSTLPSGVSLNSSTGVISGTLPSITTDTTYSFTVNASDGLNTIPRAFSINSVSKIDVEYLLVAGGGGGASWYGGGGGAGGLLSGAEALIPGNTKLITIGLGGAGRPATTAGSNATDSFGSKGQNSVYGSLTALGGGGAPGSNSGGLASIMDGGSGAGGRPNNYSSAYSFGVSLSSQGNSGGVGNPTASGQYSDFGGGGGGAGGAGANGAVGGAGGAGIQSSITGTALFYAGGGGGGSGTQGATASGGSGVGGTGTSNVSGGNAVANTGSGGGGSTNVDPGTGGVGGNGSAGVVIIAYSNTKPALTIPGTLTYDQPTRAGYRVYRFTAGTGTVTF